MKNQEAIKAIKDNMPTAGTYTMLTEALHIAIEALEKQILKHAIPVDYNYSDLPVMGCTTCRSRNICFDDKFCRDCGQAINWTKVE